MASWPASGGRPSITNGALLAVVLGGAWSHSLPGVVPGACALIGAGAFLGASMQMPLTAVVLIVEFTHANHGLLYPLLLAVAGSVLTYWAAPGLLAPIETLAREESPLSDRQAERTSV